MNRRKETISVPVGLEQLLLAAATDPELRAELVRDRAGAAERHGLALTASERAVLTIASGEQLAAMIERLDTSERNLAKHKFMRAVAAAAVTLAAGTGLGACGGPGDQPAAENDAPFHGRAERVDIEVLPAEPAGIRSDDPIERPDAGPVKIEIPEPGRNARGGARPDIAEILGSPTVEIEGPERNLDGGARPDWDED